MRQSVAALRRKITSDWLILFPAIGILKPLHLARRVGPLLQGIVLQRSSLVDEYRPASHVHCLASEFPALTLTLVQYLRTKDTGARDGIRVQYHEREYQEAAQRVRTQAKLPLEGDLGLGDVVGAYEKEIARPGVHFDASLYEELASIFTWAGRTSDSARVIDAAASAMRAWPPAVSTLFGGVDGWRERNLKRVNDPTTIRAVADREAEKFGADRLPQAQMVILPG